MAGRTIFSRIASEANALVLDIYNYGNVSAWDQ